MWLKNTFYSGCFLKCDCLVILGMTLFHEPFAHVLPLGCAAHSMHTFPPSPPFPIPAHATLWKQHSHEARLGKSRFFFIYCKQYQVTKMRKSPMRNFKDFPAVSLWFLKSFAQINIQREDKMANEASDTMRHLSNCYWICFFRFI